MSVYNHKRGPDARGVGAAPSPWSAEWRTVFLVCVGVLVITFWQSLASFIPTADDEMSPRGLLNLIFAQGRLFAYLLLNTLSPAKEAPTVDMLISIVALSGSVVVILWTWRSRIQLAHYSAAVIAATFPTTVHMFEFTSVNVVVAVACLLSSLSVALFLHRRHFLSWIMIFVAVGMYQGILLHSFVAYAILIIAHLFDEDRPVRSTFVRASFYALSAVSSAGAYSALVSCYFKLYGYEMRWIQNVLRPEELLNPKVWTLAFGFLWKILIGSDDLFLQRDIPIGVIQLAILSFAIVGCLLNSPTNVRRALSVLLLLAVVAAPFLSIALTGGVIRYRTLLAAPIAIAGIALIAGLDRPTAFQRTVLTAASLVSFMYLQTSVQMISAAKLSWEADRDLSNRIIDRLESSYPNLFYSTKPIPLEMVGYYDRESPWIPNVRSSTLGVSFYKWDHAPGRIAGALSIMRHGHFRPINNAERVRIIDHINSMPLWPAKGSVATIDGIVVIKFQPSYSTFQIHIYCRGSAECAASLGSVGH